MKLQECFDLFGGSYADVKSRLVKDELIQRFLIKFLSDKSYDNLTVAIRNMNYEEAFMAVHTLKGLSKNFSFDRLSASSEALTELLRNWETEPVDEAQCQELFEQVTSDYNEVVRAIEQLRDSE